MNNTLPNKDVVDPSKGTFIVEAIIGRRIKKGKKEYLIKWKGYPESQATWEPERNLKNLKEILKHYDKLLERSKKKRRRETSKNKKFFT